MSYSTSANFISIDSNINNFEKDINNLSLEIIEDNLLKKNIKSIKSDKDAFILKNEIASSSILVENIDNYFQYLLNIQNIENTIGDNFRNKVFLYYYEDGTANGSLKLINNKSTNLFSDIDISYYINKKYLNYIILYDFLSQYNKNLSKLIQTFNIIDNQTFYDYDFSFDMKYYYHPTFGYNNINTFNKLGLPDSELIDGSDKIDNFKINSYNIKFKIGDFNNYYNNNEFVNIDDNTIITITNCEIFYDSKYNDIIDQSLKDKICNYLKVNFETYIYNKFIFKNSKEFLSIKNLSNTYFHYLGKHLQLQINKNLLNYIILFSIYFYIKFNYRSKLGEISDIINNDFHILFKNIFNYLDSTLIIIENTQKKIFRKQQQIDDQENIIISTIERLKDDLNNPDKDKDTINQAIEDEKQKLIDLKKKNLLDNTQYQVKKAIDDKKTLYDINKRIEETDIDIKNINNLKKLQNSYLDKIDIISYFIYFFIIVTFFVFSINASLNNSINISIPIVLIIISIILYIILNYIIKNSYHSNYNNINNNNSILHSLYYSILNTNKFELFNTAHQSYPTLTFIQNNPDIQQLFDKYDHDTKDILKRTIISLTDTPHTFYNSQIQDTKLDNQFNKFYKYRFCITHTKTDDSTFLIDLLNKSFDIIDTNDMITTQSSNSLDIVSNNKYTNNSFFGENWFKYHSDFVKHPDNNNIYSTDIKVLHTKISSNGTEYGYIILPHNESKNSTTNTDNYTEYKLNIPQIFKENPIEFDIILVSGGESGQNMSDEGFGGAGGSGGSVKKFTTTLQSGQYTIKVGGGGKIKHDDNTHIPAHDTEIFRDSDSTLIEESTRAKKILTSLSLTENNKYYSNNTPNTNNYLNFSQEYTNGGINNSLLPILTSGTTRTYYTKSGNTYVAAAQQTTLNDIYKKNVNGFDGYMFPSNDDFGIDNLDFRINNPVINLNKNIFAAGGGGGFYNKPKNGDTIYLSSHVDNTSVRYYNYDNTEFPGIGGSLFVDNPNYNLYYTFDDDNLDSKTYGGRGSNGSMGGKARSAINNSGSGGGGGSKSNINDEIQKGGNGSGGIVIMRYKISELNTFVSQKDQEHKNEITEKLKAIIIDIATLKTVSDQQKIQTQTDQIDRLKTRYSQKEEQIIQLDKYLEDKDLEKQNIIDEIGNDQEGIIKEIDDLKNNIASYDSSIKTYDSQISTLLTEKEKNERDYDGLLAKISQYDIDNRKKDIEKKKLLQEKIDISQQLGNLQKEKSDLEAKKNLYDQCKADSDYIKSQLYIYEQSLDCQYGTELSELTKELKSRREEALRESLRQEKKRDDILQSQIKVQEDYDKEIQKLITQKITDDDNSTRILTLKLNIDYRRTGIFSSDINAIDLIEDSSSDEMKDIKEILSRENLKDPDNFQKEQEKRRNFIETIQFELTNALEISYAENKNRFNILRIYPGNIQRKQTDSSSQSQTQTFGITQLSDFETVPDDIKEDFALFNVKEHFFDQYSTMNENDLIRQNRKKSYIQPKNLTIIQIQIMPAQRSSQKTTKEILDKLISKNCIDNNNSLLRNSSKSYLRYIVAYKIDDDSTWTNIDNIAITEYSSFDLLESNYDLINQIDSKLTKIINTDLQPDIVDYYDKINPYVEKEINKYNNIDNNIKLYNRIADNTKEINIYDIRYKELLLDLIILISFILSIFLLIFKFFNNFILYLILFIIISILVFIYYINYHKIVNTKPDNNYWNTFKN